MTTNTNTIMTSNPPPNKHKVKSNDNFIRLNLRNNAGSCRGAKNLKAHNRQKRRAAKWRMEKQDRFNEREERMDKGKDGGGGGGGGGTRRGLKPISGIHDAMDPIHDFLDGSYHAVAATRKDTPSKKDGRKDTIYTDTDTNMTAPLCPHHNRSCKLLTVRTNARGNKGRKFYVCSMPQGEQCNFFQWHDDSTSVVQEALLKTSSASGFVARQVARHVDRYKTLTVPELKVMAVKRGLKTTGAKMAILARLAIWVRDEISSSVEGGSIEEEEKKDGDEDDGVQIPLQDIVTLDDEDSTCSDSSCGEEDVSDSDGGNSSEEELEICSLSSISRRKNDKSISENDPSTPLHSSLYDTFGYKDFRNGQEWAIRRCLSRKRSLLVAPTGMGKSLCYALPASLMDGICVVVSPLVSLMEVSTNYITRSFDCVV
jgi:hypothetical protein